MVLACDKNPGIEKSSIRDIMDKVCMGKVKRKLSLRGRKPPGPGFGGPPGRPKGGGGRPPRLEMRSTFIWVILS